ncbi:MAG: polyprenyl diphosphate synthase [Bacteroidales bacterium]|nr:polyprenyl diphosphate synthase [Bacteroidales bacterium]
MEQGNKIPVHVSIIMDGNGRWAKARGKERVQGHLEGVGSVRACTEAAVEAGVKVLSLFAFSEENWGRPEKEVSTLMELMFKSMIDEFSTLMDNGVRFVVLGHREKLSKNLNIAIDDLMKKTEANATMTMIIFLSYSGKWDIMQATKRIAKEYAGREDEIDALTEADFSKYLVTAGYPDPDLIIRTSGEKRMSNYLLWQGAYSELLFDDTLWPDFRKEQFFSALKEYASRDRRYGKVK